MEKNKVSICIPTYLHPEYVDRLLESVFTQKFTDYSIVISDNSNNDSVYNVLQKYPKNKINYHKNNPSLPITENWNNAINKASGQYVKVMFSDDWFSSEYSLSKLVEMLDCNPHADFAFCASHNVSSSKTKIHFITQKQADDIKLNPKCLFRGNYIGAPSATIFRNKGFLFDVNLKWLVDLDLYIRILLSNKRFYYTTEPLISIGIHDNQLTNDCAANNFVNLMEYKHLFDKFELYNDLECRLYYIKQIIINRCRLGKLREFNVPIFEYIDQRLKMKLRSILNRNN